MDRLSINIGNQENDGLGDKIRDAFIKINTNFEEVFNTNATGASTSAVDVVSAAVANEASVRSAADLVLTGKINAVSAVVNTLSANHVSIANKVSAILNSNTTFAAPIYNFTGNTESVSATTGTVVVTGGVGVSGNIFVNALYTDNYYLANGDPFGGGGGGGSGTVGSGTAGQLTYYQNSGTSVKGATNLTYDTNRLTLASGNAATSTSTGALVVSGGAGISGNLYVGGSLNLNGADISAAVASINQEISVLSNQVSVLSNALSATTSAVAAETSARIAASAALELHINQVNATIPDGSAINNAISAISAAVATNSAQITSIAIDLSTKIDTVSINLVNEISNRRSASAALETHINAVSNAISVVSAQVATNSAQMTSANNAISNAISVVSAQVATNSAQMTSVNNDLSAEIINRISADDALSNAVSATYAPKANPRLTGNVGIGTSNVTDTLHLYGNTATVSPSITVENPTNLSFNRPALKFLKSNSAARSSSFIGELFFIDTNTANTTYSSQILGFSTTNASGSENMSIYYEAWTDHKFRVGNGSGGYNTKLTLNSTTLTAVGNISINSDDNATAIVNAGTNGVGNIGASGASFNTIFAAATQAQYADLAENYIADAQYEPGTVVQFGTDSEVTAANLDATTKIVGVVSTKPAYLMNTALAGQYVVPVALMGRVPCKVKGRVNRGDLLVAATDGYARAETHPIIGSLVGKAIDDFYGDKGIIEIIVGLK